MTDARPSEPAEKGGPGAAPAAMPPVAPASAGLSPVAAAAALSPVPVAPASAALSSATSRRLIERGRSKAFRPLPRDVRVADVERGLAAYDRGAWYLAHEELEPAWMGTDDPAERALLSGLIKLAAAYVHVARGNPLGARTNLRGARDRLATAAGLRAEADRTAGAVELKDRPVAVGELQEGPTGAAVWIDLPSLLDAIEERLSRIETRCAEPLGSGARRVVAPAPSHDVAGPAGRLRGAPVELPPLPLPRRLT